MSWTAPDADRVTPHYVAGERQRLDSWLDFERATLLAKCAGLTADQLVCRPVATSSLSLLGLVRHAAANERVWFRIRLGGEDIPDLYEDDEAEFDAEPAQAEADLATYLAEVEEARRVVAARSLDETFGDETHTVDVRWLYAHMIGEYARHNGHADMIRELIDGSTGF